MTRQVVDALRRGEPTAHIAMAAHRGLAAAAAEVVRTTAPELPVVLTGGCFQNAILTHALASNLQGKDGEQGRRGLLHRQAPPNDGGIALGQIWAASAMAQ